MCDDYLINLFYLSNPYTVRKAFDKSEQNYLFTCGCMHRLSIIIIIIIIIYSSLFSKGKWCGSPQCVEIRIWSTWYAMVKVLHPDPVITQVGSLFTEYSSTSYCYIIIRLKNQNHIIIRLLSPH